MIAATGSEPILFFNFFLLFRATPMAYGGYQARGGIGAAAEAYPTAMATLDLHINITSSATLDQSLIH